MISLNSESLHLELRLLVQRFLISNLNIGLNYLSYHGLHYDRCPFSSFQSLSKKKTDSPVLDFDFGSREDQVTRRTTDASATNSQALKSSAILHLLDEYNDPVDVIVAKKVFLVRPNILQNSDSRTSTKPSYILF